MKTMLILLASCSLLAGCVSTETFTQLKTRQGEENLQMVAPAAAQPPEGFGDLQISLTLKTRSPGTLLFDTTGYGTERYQLLLRVGNQTQRVTGSMTAENGEYRGSHDPEAGRGVRYRFTTSLRLPVGTHLLTLAVPGDGVLLEQQVEVRQGSNRLQLSPVYRAKSSHRLLGFRGTSSFYEGIKALIAAERC